MTSDILLRVSVEAENDLREIGDYIAEHDKRAAKRYIQGIVDRCRLQENAPFQGRSRSEVSPDLRSVVYRNHVVLYKLMGDMILIVRVIHQRRDLVQAFNDNPDSSD